MSEKRVNVKMREFVTAHQGAENVAAVAAATGLTEGSCQARASKYRKMGIQLKQFPRGGGARLDIAEANALIAELAAEGEGEE